MRIHFSLVLLATACGAPDAGGLESEYTEETSDAFGESSCLTATANATLENRGGALASPTTYTNPACTKSFIYQLDTAFPSAASGAVYWTDMWSRNEVQCRNGVLRLQVISRGSSGGYRDEGTFSFPLFWDATNQYCWYPILELEQSPGLAPRIFSDYVPARGEGGGPQPSIPSAFMSFPLPTNLTARTVRFVTQALTPRRSTQSVSAVLGGF
jgi:hypothetical protein